MRRAALLALAAALAGFSPLEREEEHVRAGNARLRAGDPAGALEAYDAAERAVGPRPEIEFDRGHAALRAGRLAEAEARFRQAARAAPPALASRALQNAGNALAAAGDRDGAARAFGEALLADPSNEDARWDLEVLLRQRDRAEPPPPPRDGGEGPSPPRGAAAQAPPPQRPGAPPPPEPDRGGTAGARPPPAAAERDAAEGQRPGAEGRGGDHALSRRDAEALLDALRAGERNMPLFGRERRQARRRDGEKDW